MVFLDSQRFLAIQTDFQYNLFNQIDENNIEIKSYKQN